MTSFWEFLINNRDEILLQTLEHIGLTAIALAIAIFIGVPLGILLTRSRRLSAPVLGVTGVIQTIPSIALLGFLIPILGIGSTPAVVALFLYALLPIVRNTFTGINEVDASVKEAAKGMGLSETQLLAKVELPLAIPVIFAGIRTATVINVGVATLCALIGAGGLGKFIFRGIGLNNMHMILAGALPAALLALILDGILGIIQKTIRKIIKPLLAVSALLIFVVIPAWILPSLFPATFQAGFTAEFMERSDGYPGLKKLYGLSLDTIEIDPGLMYQALKEGKVDVISGYSTDGRIKAFDLRVLEDDRLYFPPYYVAPLVRGETLRKYPGLGFSLSLLAGKIPGEKMREMNYRVDHGKEDPAKVAEDFIQKLELPPSINSAPGKNLGDNPRRGYGKITIGGKNFTEQYILAHIFARIIERYSGLEVEFKTGLAGTKICFDALVSGEIDIYPEYTGTGLMVLLDIEKETRNALLHDKQAVYDYVKTELKKSSDIVWLEPLGFNNTYALMMRNDQAEELEIETISDLKVYLDSRRLKGKEK